MARSHSGKKGQSGSKKPIKKVSPAWMKYKAKEVELLVVKYGKEGKTPSQIGLFLRDVYGIPSVKTVTKKSISQILDEKKMGRDVPEDLVALIRRAVMIKKHLEENKHDQPAKLGLRLTENKIMSLAKYYKRIKKIPSDWKYNPETAKIYLG
jgi:small subunit ribosomal protein S15